MSLYKTTIFAALCALSAITQAAPIDDFSVKQRAFDRGNDNLASTTYRTIETRCPIPEFTRHLVSYTPEGKYNYTDSFIVEHELFITNRIVDGVSVGSGTSLIYEFNNFNLYRAAKGFYIKLGESKSDGFVIVSTNGPSGFSYSNFHSVQDGYIFVPLTEFNGSRNFMNVNWLRIDFVNVDSYAGKLEFGLVENKRFKPA
ncbi:MAG: hypothetical protein ACXWTU_00485 [Methylotenera sp.]